ncbi:MAG: AmmeMemoRadiSam system protein B [Woeseiaceae bacterium]|jgi:AmmeMemoRadiSam system protein B|nr:AmmeMemoRadiSam system protein B [Woeseiaceae bacterium]
MNTIREPAVAGRFYAKSAGELARSVATMLDAVPVISGPAPKALIVPHAGYVYSGPVAARAYAELRPWHDRYRRVVLLGPSHRVAFRGLATTSAALFRTPLGDLRIDHEAAAGLDIPGLAVADAPHAHEHSLEVQLPFLASVLDDFALVPIVVGDAAPALVARVLDALWDGPETLIVISSDLSHYLAYDDALEVDARTCRAIEHFDAERLDHDMACGATPIAGLLIAARRRGLDIRTLDLRNSGDTSGDKSTVVGYGAWMLFDKPGSE